jgi:hypothetical protein
MNKNWRALILIAALGFGFGLSGVAYAQEEPIAGGWAGTSTTDPEVIAATRFAIARQNRKQGSRISLTSIDRAEVQVVAGLNYKMWLNVKTRGQSQKVTTVVYKNLKRQYSLTSWEVENASSGSESTTAGSAIEQLVASLAEAYTSKSLGKLDAQRPYVGRFRIVVENSLAEPNAKDRFEIRTFNTLARAEQWLRSQETSDDTPSRQTKPLKKCARGVCTYDFDGGISHNQLYIKKVTYGITRGRPYFKTIYLLDGN